MWGFVVYRVVRSSSFDEEQGWFDPDRGTPRGEVLPHHHTPGVPKTVTGFAHQSFPWETTSTDGCRCSSRDLGP